MFSFAKVEEKKKYLLLLFLTILTLKEKSLYAKNIALNIICGKGQQNRLRRQSLDHPWHNIWRTQAWEGLNILNCFLKSLWHWSKSQVIYSVYCMSIISFNGCYSQKTTYENPQNYIKGSHCWLHSMNIYNIRSFLLKFC